MTDPAVTESAPSRGRTRLGAYAICRDDDGRILLARLSAIEVDVGAWTLPGGGVDFGEHPDAAAIRELEEETGLDGEIEAIAGVFSHVYRRSTVRRGRRPPLPRHRLPRCGSSAASCATRSTARPTRAPWFGRDELAGIRLVELAQFAVGLASCGPGCRAPGEKHDRDRRRRAGRARLPARPRRRALAAAAPPLRRGPADPPRGRRRARRPDDRPAAARAGARASRCRSRGGRGRGATSRRSGCGSSTGRRDRRHGRHVADRTARRPAAGSRSTTTSDRRVPALGGLHRPRLHPPDRVADAGDVQGDRRGGRAETSTGPSTNLVMSDRRVFITGIGVVTAIGTGVDAVPGGAAGRPLADQADRSVRPVAVPLARSPPRSTTSTRSRGCRRRPPASSTGSASSGSSPGTLALDDAGMRPGEDGAASPERIGIYLGSALGGIVYAEEQHERYLEQGHPPGRAEPRARGVRRRGAGEPRDRARRPRADPLDRQLVRQRGGRDRRGARGDPGRRDRRRDRRRRRDPVEPARVRGVRHHPGAVGRLQRRPRARLPPVRREARRVRHGRGRGAARARGGGRRPARSGAEPYAEVMGYGSTSDAFHMVQPRADGSEAARAASIAMADAGGRAGVDRLRQRPRVVDAARRHRGGTRDRAGPGPGRRGARAGERHEGAVRPPARRVGRDRGRDLRARDPRRLGAGVGEPRRAGPGDRRVAAEPPVRPAGGRVPTGFCRPRSGSAG